METCINHHHLIQVSVTGTFSSARAHGSWSLPSKNEEVDQTEVREVKQGVLRDSKVIAQISQREGDLRGLSEFLSPGDFMGL